MAKLTGAGTDDKKKVAIAGALGVAVLALAIHTLFGGPSATEPPATAPTGLTAAGQSAAMHESLPAASTAEARIDPVLHTGLMAANENYLYQGSGRNIFAAESAPPPPVKIEKVLAPVRPSTAVAAIPQPVGPPPIALKFFGYVAPKGSVPQRAFLLGGSNVFVARVGDVVSHRYKIMQIGPSSVQIQDLAYNDTQSLPLTRN